MVVLKSVFLVMMVMELVVLVVNTIMGEETLQNRVNLQSPFLSKYETTMNILTTCIKLHSLIFTVL